MVRAYITGFHQIIEKESNRSFFELIGEVAQGALEMGGLSIDAIDGLGIVHTTAIDDKPIRVMLANQVANYLGINKLKYIDVAEFGGASFNALVYRAVKAVERDIAKAVLVIGGGKSSVFRRRRFDENLVARNYVSTHSVVEFLPTSDYAMVAMRYSHVYNASDEGRAMIAVRERANARYNKDALFREPISVADVLKSPMVSYPLRLLEVVMPVDGMSAFLIVNEDLAKKSRITPVSVLGYGEAHDPRPLFDRDDILDTVIPISAGEALNSANVGLDDIDLFMLYDAYTIMVVLELEGIGLAKKGLGWRFAEEHDFSPSSTYPINVNGGSLNMGQPAYMSGGVILTEALIQLTGMAGERQVKGASKVLINAIGGILNHSTTLILGA